MAGAELPDGYHYETLAAGTDGEMDIRVLDEPQSDIIEFAPEVPAGLHLPPRHTPREMGQWLAITTMGRREAARLFSPNGHPIWDLS
jgi:hypothetical protein